eukprot:2601476-Prymnesium_polylepis.1
MARVCDARRANDPGERGERGPTLHAEVMHQAGAGATRESVMQGSGMGEGGGGAPRARRQASRACV